jgi:DNA-binding CsgD family transcriptional regulator
MPRFSRAQETARRRIVDLAASGLSPEVFAQQLLAVLATAIPSDGQRLFGVDPETLLFNRLLAASEGDEPFRLRWLRDIYLAHGPAAYMSAPAVMRAGLPITLLRDRQDLCWGLPMSMLAQVAPWDHARVFHETSTPAGGFLRVCLGAEGRWIAVLDIVRRSPGRPLHPPDAAFMRAVAPTVARALAAALTRERAREDGTGEAPSASGILVLSCTKHLEYVTPAGETWLRMLRDAQREAHAPLPTGVWAAVAGLRLDPEGNGASVVVTPTPFGPVRIEASAGGADGSVAVILEPLRRSVTATVPEHWPLTPQERQIAGLLTHGLSNRQLAERLCVSEKTIEAHLGHTFEKLGVRGRSQLLARLFRETHFLRLTGGPGPHDSRTTEGAHAWPAEIPPP